MSEPSYTAADLELANRHVVQASRRVAQQLSILRGLEVAAHDTAYAKLVLAMLEEALQSARGRRDAIWDALEGGDQAGGRPPQSDIRGRSIDP